MAFSLFALGTERLLIYSAYPLSSAYIIFRVFFCQSDLASSVFLRGVWISPLRTASSVTRFIVWTSISAGTWGGQVDLHFYQVWRTEIFLFLSRGDAAMHPARQRPRQISVLVFHPCFLPPYTPWEYRYGGWIFRKDTPLRNFFLRWTATPHSLRKVLDTLPFDLECIFFSCLMDDVLTALMTDAPPGYHVLLTQRLAISRLEVGQRKTGRKVKRKESRDVRSTKR